LLSKKRYVLVWKEYGDKKFVLRDPLLTESIGLELSASMNTNIK
jgi:hypothetical protein